MEAVNSALTILALQTEHDPALVGASLRPVYKLVMNCSSVRRSDAQNEGNMSTNLILEDAPVAAPRGRPNRPASPGPGPEAPLAEREAWSAAFVAFYIAETGGELESNEVPAGHRWRTEYFSCFPDPAAYERAVAHEIGERSAR